MRPDALVHENPLVPGDLTIKSNRLGNYSIIPIVSSEPTPIHHQPWSYTVNPQQQLREAKILFASGQLDKSIESFNRAEEQGSDIIDTGLSRGAALMALHRFEEAERDFSNVLEADGDNERAYYFRGVARAALGQYQAAILDFTQSLRRNSERGLARLLRGLAYSELGQSNDAEQDFNSVASFSEYEMENFKNVFGVIDSPFKNTKAMVSKENGSWKNVLSDRSAQMLRNLLDD